ncbi:MAG: hypothetical protein K6T75_01865 [Acetobacteraceae bacterium]|nr:hypothetical protein [Acetobacteraceae bacterium]
MIVAQGRICRPDVGWRAVYRRSAARGRRGAGAGAGGLSLTRFLGLALLAVALGLAVCAGYAAIAARGYHLEQLRSELLALEREGERLELEAARLGSVARVAEVAGGRLALGTPGPGFAGRSGPPPALALGEGGGVTPLGGAGPSPGWAVGRVAMASALQPAAPGQALAPPVDAAAAAGEAPAEGGGPTGLWAALARWLPGLRHAEAHPLPQN